MNEEMINKLQMSVGKSLDRVRKLMLNTDLQDSDYDEIGGHLDGHLVVKQLNDHAKGLLDLVEARKKLFKDDDERLRAMVESYIQHIVIEMGVALGVENEESMLYGRWDLSDQLPEYTRFQPPIPSGPDIPSTEEIRKYVMLLVQHLICTMMFNGYQPTPRAIVWLMYSQERTKDLLDFGINGPGENAEKLYQRFPSVVASFFKNSKLLGSLTATFDLEQLIVRLVVTATPAGFGQHINGEPLLPLTWSENNRKRIEEHEAEESKREQELVSHFWTLNAFFGLEQMSTGKFTRPNNKNFQNNFVLTENELNKRKIEFFEDEKLPNQIKGLLVDVADEILRLREHPDELNLRETGASREASPVFVWVDPKKPEEGRVSNEGERRFGPQIRLGKSAPIFQTMLRPRSVADEDPYVFEYGEYASEPYPFGYLDVRQDVHNAVLSAFFGNVGFLNYSLQDKSLSDPDFLHGLLKISVMRGHKELVELLLDAGAPVQATKKYVDEETPEFKATYHEFSTSMWDEHSEKYNQSILHFALDCYRNASKQFTNEPDWQKAKADTKHILYEHKDIIELIVKKQPALMEVVNSSGETPIWSVVKKSQPRRETDVLKLLIDNGADLSVVDEGSTLLHYAVDRDQASLLINAGLDVDASDNDGRTPLHSLDNGYRRGAEHEDGYEPVDVAQLLVLNRADIEARNAADQSPLESAASLGMWRVVEYLLSVGADPNRKDKNGWTALHHGCHVPEGYSEAFEKSGYTRDSVEEGNRAEVARVLIDHGASVDAVTNEGDSVLDIARKDPDYEAFYLQRILEPEAWSENGGGQ